MADSLAIRDAIADALATTGLHAYKGYRDQVDTPCAVVGIPTEVSYDDTFNPEDSTPVFKVRVLVGRHDEQVSEERLADYLKPSELKAAIEADPTLDGTADTVQVTSATGIGLYTYGEINYLGAELNITVTT